MTYTLEETRERLRTQDNQYTAEPIFLVQEKVRMYGIDTEYAPKVAWLYFDECVEVDPNEAACLEAAYQNDGDAEPEGFRRVGYDEGWEFVTCCFTDDAANEYITRNTHRHRGELRTYVDSGRRNPEWKAIRTLLMGEVNERSRSQRLGTAGERPALEISWPEGRAEYRDPAARAEREAGGAVPRPQ